MPTILLDFSSSNPLEIPENPASKMDITGLANGTKPRARIPAVTDFSAFSGESLLCVVDGDNWDIALKTHGLKVRYDKLLRQLRGLAGQLCAVVVITSNPGDYRHEDALRHCGWRVLSIPRQTIANCTGVRKVANA